MLLAEVSDGDYRAVVKKLVALAKKGDLAAIRELLDRLLGKPTLIVEPESQPRFLTREQMRDEVMRRIGALRAKDG